MIAFRPRNVMQHMKFVQHGFTLYQADEVTNILRGTGFIENTEQNYETDNLGFTCMSATKSGEASSQRV